ncbi:hypothetical protein HDU93_001082 [Gonapodya sp. JEL0774]|nr:hypothetical protein HDU93_001082 [Gonapodya sp. JEL0774]
MDLDWCLVCDKRTEDDVYCSEDCRIVDQLRREAQSAGGPKRGVNGNGLIAVERLKDDSDVYSGSPSNDMGRGVSALTAAVAKMHPGDISSTSPGLSGSVAHRQIMGIRPRSQSHSHHGTQHRPLFQNTPLVPVSTSPRSTASPGGSLNQINLTTGKGLLSDQLAPHPGDIHAYPHQHESLAHRAAASTITRAAPFELQRRRRSTPHAFLVHPDAPHLDQFTTPEVAVAMAMAASEQEQDSGVVPLVAAFGHHETQTDDPSRTSSARPKYSNGYLIPSASENPPPDPFALTPKSTVDSTGVLPKLPPPSGSTGEILEPPLTLNQSDLEAASLAQPGGHYKVLSEPVRPSNIFGALRQGLDMTKGANGKSPSVQESKLSGGIVAGLSPNGRHGGLYPLAAGSNKRLNSQTTDVQSEAAFELPNSRPSSGAGHEEKRGSRPGETLAATAFAKKGTVILAHDGTVLGKRTKDGSWAGVSV